MSKTADINKGKKNIADRFEERLIKNEKFRVPTLIVLTLIMIIINLVWGSDRLVLSQREGYEMGEATEQVCDITMAERVEATINRVEMISYNSGYWKVRVFYNNLAQMCMDKGIVRAKLNKIVCKITGRDSCLYDEYGPERISPFELGIKVGDPYGGEEY